MRKVEELSERCAIRCALAFGLVFFVGLSGCRRQTEAEADAAPVDDSTLRQTSNPAESDPSLRGATNRATAEVRTSETPPGSRASQLTEVETERAADEEPANAAPAPASETRPNPTLDPKWIAVYNEAFQLFKGDGVERDVAEAVRLFRQAAEGGHSGAQHNLGMLYLHGEGVDPDPQQAREWLEKAAAAGLAEAEFKLASIYAMGLGVERDFEEAAQWVRRAAEQGHADAQYNLATLYLRGEGVEQDLSQAAIWYQKAAEQGHATAQANLGVFYATGQHVPQDMAAAEEWFRKAAERGSPTAQLNLARFYREGQVVEKDLIEAYKWLSLAADQGDRDAAEEQVELAAKLKSSEIVEAIRRATRFRQARLQRLGAQNPEEHLQDE